MPFLNKVASFKPDWRTITSALLLVLAFPPWNIAPLIWFALVPWFFAISRTTTKKDAFIQGLWLCFLMSLGGFYWVAYVLNEFGDVGWPISIVGLLLFCLFNEIQFLVFAPLQLKIQKEVSAASSAWKAALLIIFAAFLYAGADAILPKLFVDTLGHAFYASPILRQIAELTGAPLLTVLIYLVNFALWNAIRLHLGRREPSIWPALKSALPALLAAFLLFSVVFTYGVFRRASVTAQMASPANTIQLAVIQANIGDFEKIAAENGIVSGAKKILDTYFDLSDKALSLSPKPEAIIWPETAYPSTFRTPETADELARDQRVESYVRDRGVPLLFGGYDRAGDKEFNTFFFLSPRSSYGTEGDLLVYRKNMLLLFGEYIPGAEYFRFIKNMFPQVGNFGHGNGPDALAIPFPVDSPRKAPIKAGPIICYEALFPNYVIETAKKGADFILNITNDSWFGPYGEPDLHLALTAFRSIETRLPQLRATNTGISALILPDGEITHATPKFEPEIMNVSVPIMKHTRTLMLMWGDWFGKFSFVLGLLGFCWLWLPGWLASRKKAQSVTQVE